MTTPRFRLADDGLAICQTEEYWNPEDLRTDERGFKVAVFDPDTTPEFRTEFVAALNKGSAAGKT